MYICINDIVDINDIVYIDDIVDIVDIVDIRMWMDGCKDGIISECRFPGYHYNIKIYNETKKTLALVI